MSAGLILKCDAPMCGRTFGWQSLMPMTTLGAKRTQAKREGWSTTSTANPYPDGVKRVTLDRCPSHKGVRLRVKIIDDSTYSIEKV
jgi:hypothetical protein